MIMAPVYCGPDKAQSVHATTKNDLLHKVKLSSVLLLLLHNPLNTLWGLIKDSLELMTANEPAWFGLKMN